VQAEAAGGKSQSSSSTYDAMTEDDLLPVHKYLDGNVAWMQLACGAKIDASCYYPGPDGFATAKWGDADVAFCYTWETDTLNEYISSDGKRLEIPTVVEPKGEGKVGRPKGKAKGKAKEKLRKRRTQRQNKKVKLRKRKVKLNVKLKKVMMRPMMRPMMPIKMRKRKTRNMMRWKTRRHMRKKEKGKRKKEKGAATYS
jgi:hypothetical protein